MSGSRRVLTLLVVVATLLVGCGTDDDPAAGDQPASVDRPAPAEASEATRDDVDCSPEALGDDEVTQFVTAHLVVDGELGALCLGDEDPTLLQSWADLAAITPADQLNDLALFAGFVNPEADQQGDDAETTLAFVNAIDDDGTAFQMSVDLDQIDADADQGLLTLAHEFSHVFTTNTTQMDRSQEAIETCDTYRSRDGCFLPDSLIAEWVQRFWADGQLDALDPEADPSVEQGEELCASDPSFLGAYAASDPEEDFAETFSAYVFAVPVDGPEIAEKLDWMADQPGLVAFRDQAEAAGLSPLPNLFDGCG